MTFPHLKSHHTIMTPTQSTPDSLQLTTWAFPLGAKCNKRNSKIPKGQTVIAKSEDRQDNGQQNETKDKHRTHNTTLKNY